MENFLREKRKKNAILRSKEMGLRRRLIKEWDLLTDEQKVITRSLRSKKGIKCEKCGCVGYFTEICPNNCYEPPAKEEITHFGLERFGSDDEAMTPIQKDQGEGFYWTNIDDCSEVEKPKRSYYPTKPDLTCLKERTYEVKDKLRASDEKLTDYEFHRHAEEGYSQNMSELSLHQALRYFMRILEREIQENVRTLESKDDLTLFHPPAEVLTSHFYPKDVEKIKEYREYFHQHAMKKDRQFHAHQHSGAIRPEDAMSVYFRVGGKSKKGDDSSLSLYEPNPKAGQSIHGKIGWKSILAKNDELAISDPKMAEKLQELTRLESQQSAWTAQQKKSFEYQNERYQHMWYIIKQEILNEHDREKRLLTVDVHANKRETEVAIWKERIDAADRLIETLRGYGYLRGTNEADYLIKGIEKWRSELAESRKRLQASGVLPKTDGKKKKKKRKTKKKENEGSHLVSSLIKIRAKTREEDQRGLIDEDQTDTDNSDNETAAKKDDDDSISIHSIRKITTAAEASHLLASTTPNQGGYHGLGLLSTFGATEIVAPVESSTSVTSQLLMKGSMGLISSEPSLANKSTSSTKMSKSASHSTFSSTKNKVGSTIMARKKIEEKQLQMLAARYTDVGLQRNIRQGTSEDISTLAPALIPFHEVLANRLPPEEIPKSIAGQNAIIQARKRDANPITGDLTPKYLPLYVRSTLFEVNGTTPGGDQTYARMSHDRRYSHQLGRTMASLEPLPIRHKKKTMKKIEEETEKKGGKIRLF